jgi:hypothetical protein
MKPRIHFSNASKVVKQVLMDSFSNRQGSDLVRDGRYVLQDSVTSSDLNPAIPFHRATRPGQRIVMTMVFHSGHQDKANTCPRCATVTMSSGGQDINWYLPPTFLSMLAFTSEGSNDSPAQTQPVM